jgi:hypothetical protein
MLIDSCCKEVHLEEYCVVVFSIDNGEHVKIGDFRIFADCKSELIDKAHSEAEKLYPMVRRYLKISKV